jgi:hypothetical protein
MARSVVATDDFNAYGSSAFPSSNWTDLDNVVGQIWVVPAGGGVAQRYSGPSTMRRDAGTYSADQYAKATLDGIVGTDSFDTLGVTARNSADVATNDDCYAVVFYDATPPELNIIRRVNGTNTQLASDTSQSWASTDTVEIEVTGVGATVTIKAFRNGVEIVSFGDTDGARITAAGRPGVYAAKSGANVFITAWEGGDVVAGASGSLLPRQRGMSGGMAELTGGMRG